MKNACQQRDAMVEGDDYGILTKEPKEFLLFADSYDRENRWWSEGMK
jgi:hypothetical protein